MKFRVTAVLWEDCFESLNAACLRLEDWLTASLSDGEFGEGIDQICFIVVASEEDPDQNSIRASAFDKLGRYKDPIHSLPVRHLSFGLSLPYGVAVSLSAGEATEAIARLIAQKTAMRPKRLPKGYNYTKLSDSIQAAAQVFTPAA